MNESLGKFDYFALCGLEKRLTKVNKDLRGFLTELKNIGRGDLDNKRELFEITMLDGDNIIPAFEELQFSMKIENELIKSFKYQKAIYQFRKEILIEAFKEAYKKSIQIK